MEVAGNLGLYLQALKNTLILVSLSFSLGLILAVPLAILRMKGHFLVLVPVRAFIWFFKGTPLLVQMLLLYYGFGLIEAMKDTFLWPMFTEPWFCALFTFCLNTCAYTTEIMRKAMVATPSAPPGEIEAARAAGISGLRMLRRVVLPLALRRVSTYSKEIVFMLHGCVLTSVIILFDISGASRIINSLYYSPYEALFSAAALYLTITLSVVLFLKLLKKRLPEQSGAGQEGGVEMEAST